MWRNNIIFSLLLFFLLSNAIVAQQDSSSYVRKFQDVFHLKIIGQFRPMAFRIKEAGSKSSLLYRPNSRPLVGIGGQVVNVGFSLMLKVPSTLWQDASVYGDTRFHDFQFNWYQPSFTIDFQYQFYEGFYVSEVKLPGLTYDVNVRRADLMIEGYDLNGVYVFNKDKLSFAAAYNHARKQMRSVGSFILMSSLKHTFLATDSLLIPSKYIYHFDAMPGYREGKFTGLAVMPGYAQTFVKDDFYLNFTIAAGPDLQYNTYTTDTGIQHNWKVEPKMNFRVGIGYDNGRFFTGFYYLRRRNIYRVDKMEIIHNSGFMRLSVGHRFPETSWMQDIRNWNLYQKVMNLF